MAKRAYSRAGILARLFNQPLAVTPQTAAIVLGAIGERFDVSQLFVAAEGRTLELTELESLAAERRIELGARGSTDRRAKNVPAESLMMVHNGVAHVGVRGETVAENGIGPMSGFTGYDGIAAQVQSADADPAVRGILLDIDSPGGEVSGLYETTSILMGRRGTKPMRAMIRGTGASAAYALACCADEVTLHDLGFAGSIGTLSMHADFSGALAQDGIKVTLFTAGAHKADGNSFEPLPTAVATEIQSMVDTANARFIAHVANARGLTEDAVRAQQAQLYMGQAAVAAGLVDQIMSWQDSMDEFEAAVNGTGSRPAARSAPSGARSAKGNSMPPENSATADTPQPEFTQAQLDSAVATARAEGVTAGVTSERERITALAELDGGTTQSAAFGDAVAAGTTAGDFAIALAKGHKAKADAALAGLKADAVKPGQLPASDAATAAGGAAPPVNRGQAAVARLRGKVPGLPASA